MQNGEIQMNKKVSKLNLSSFNLSKGFGIITVILVHTISYYDSEQSHILQGLFYYLKLVAPGIMPMFFMISGYGFKPTAQKMVLKKTFRDFLMPYIYVMIGYTVVYPITMLVLYKSCPNAVYETTRFTLAFLFGLSKEGFVLFGYPLRFCAAAWYFLASFGALNLLNIMAKIKNIALQVLSVCFCIVCAFLLLKQNIYYYCLPQSLIAVGYCYMGYLIKKYKILHRMLNTTSLYFVLIPITLAEGIWGYFDMSGGIFACYWVDYVAAGCAGLLFVMVGINMSQHEGKIVDIIMNIGIYSYWILIIHSVEMMALPWTIWPDVIPERQVLAYFIEQLMRIILITTGCYTLKKSARHMYRRKQIWKERPLS